MVTRLSSHVRYSPETVKSPVSGEMDARMESICREIEEKYHSFFESIEQGYYEIDIHGNFTFFNDFICKILGCSREELTGANFMGFLDKEDYQKVVDAFKGVSDTGKPRIGIVCKVVRKDGAKRNIGTSICLITDGKNKGTGFRGIAKDISERKDQEKQLKHTQKMESIGQLAAGIAHEINTPIQYIGDNVRFLQDSFQDIGLVLDGYRDLLEKAKGGGGMESSIAGVENAIKETDLSYLREEIPRAIDQSLEGLKHVADIVLAMKQLCHPGIEEKRLTDINYLIQNVVTVTRNKWKYVADLITDFDPFLPMVPCLESEMNQVILNLIVNAAHAIEEAITPGSGDKGTIRITTSHEKSWTEIRVSDTGPGIPKDVRSKVFDPFFTTKEVGKGSGQGLAISHSVVVNKHGGKIGFETETGKGTTMIVRLPMEIKDE